MSRLRKSASKTPSKRLQKSELDPKQALALENRRMKMDAEKTAEMRQNYLRPQQPAAERRQDSTLYGPQSRPSVSRMEKMPEQVKNEGKMEEERPIKGPKTFDRPDADETFKNKFDAPIEPRKAKNLTTFGTVFPEERGPKLRSMRKKNSEDEPYLPSESGEKKQTRPNTRSQNQTYIPQKQRSNTVDEYSAKKDKKKAQKKV